MRLDIDCISLTDFKSFQGEHIFNVRDVPNGLHFVRGRNDHEKRLGPNGTGKSTLLSDAINWCLFGATVDGLKNTDVKPWHFKGTTTVGLAIVRGKSKHSIVRSINPNRLMIDRKDAGQEQVESLIGMGPKLFQNTIVLAQGQKLFFDLPPKEKMQLFVDALGLDRWDDRAGAAVARVSELTTKIATYEGEATGLNSTLTTIDTLMDEAEKKAETWEEEWHARTKGAKKELAQCKAALEDATIVRNQHDLELDGAETELRALATQFEKASDALTAANQAFFIADEADKSNRSACLELKRKLTAMGEGNKCDQCGQSLRGTSLEKHRKQINEALRKREAEVRKGISADICDAVDNAQADVNQTRRDLLAFKTKADTARDNLDVYQRKVAELEGQRKALEEAANTKEAETNPHQSQLRELKKKRKLTVRELEDVAHDIKVSDKARERAKFWTKGFKDIRLFVMEEIMEELELATNAMLDEAGLVGWRVAYVMERETARGSIAHGMTIMVRSPSSEGMVKWESWSGGEAQRLRIVGALALSEVLLNHAGVETSMEVLDEPTQHLSPQGVTDLCEYLSDRARRLHRQIWYVDHASIESTRFASVTTIRRDKGGSHIVITG